MANNLLSDTIGLLIVMYNPSNNDINNVKAIACHYKGIVVDNSQERSFAENSIGHMTYVPLGENTGIAHAQNVGLQYLMANTSITHIVFFDQDSRFSCDFPQKLQAEYVRLKTEIKNLALLGPMVVEQDTQEEYKSMIHETAIDEKGFEHKRDVISSGSIVDVTTLRSIGPMLASMFIDYVDFEWCWRAEHKGYVCGMTHSIKLAHKVGGESFSLGRYKVLVWSPFRYFYQFRNFLWLTTLSYVPIQWKLATAAKFAARFFYLPFVVTNGSKCWAFMLKGMLCALKGFRNFRKEANAYG